jgi:hypothetical protein
VALLARSFKDVCLLDGVVGVVAVKVGLDSMSSNSLISTELVKRLGARARVVQNHHLDIATAGGKVRVDSFVNIRVQMEESASVGLNLRIIEMYRLDGRTLFEEVNLRCS